MGHFSSCVYSDGANDNDVDFVISDKLIISLLTISSLSQPLFRASLNNLRIAISLPIQLFRPNSRQFAGSEKLVQPPAYRLGKGLQHVSGSRIKLHF